jgi:hypothetical protein
MLIVGSLLAGLMLSTGYIAVREYFDTTIKDPEKAERLTGLSFAGALPLVEKSANRVSFAFVEEKLLNQCISKLKLQPHNHKGDKPFLIIMFSVREDEGKSHFGSRLTEKLNRSGHPTLLCEPINKQKRTDESAFAYKLPVNFTSVNSLQELTGRSFNNYDYVILEIPSILSHALPVQLMQQADLSLMVVSADRTWDEADAYSLSRFKEVAARPVLLLLNRVKMAYLEGIIGKIRKHK